MHAAGVLRARDLGGATALALLRGRVCCLRSFLLVALNSQIHFLVLIQDFVQVDEILRFAFFELGGHNEGARGV